MTRKNTFLFIVLIFALNYSYSQTIFDWDNPTPVDNGNNVTQAKDGILCTFIGDAFTQFSDEAGIGGSTGNIVRTGNDVGSITFTFDQAINVVSILALDGSNGSLASTYTFTPTGGSNSVVVANIDVDNSVTLNWTGVTSFTVVSDVDVLMGFDNLVVQNFPLSSVDYENENILTHPNPVVDYLNIDNVKNYEDTHVYNSLGQLMFKSKETLIDLRNLNQGIYYLKINTQNSSEVKKIIKK